MKYSFNNVMNKFYMDNRLIEYLTDNVKETGIVKMIQNYYVDTKIVKMDIVRFLFMNMTKKDLKLFFDINNLRYKYFNNSRKHEICGTIEEYIQLIAYKFSNKKGNEIIELLFNVNANDVNMNIDFRLIKHEKTIVIIIGKAPGESRILKTFKTDKWFDDLKHILVEIFKIEFN